jgi:hypothetical protein
MLSHEETTVVGVLGQFFVPFFVGFEIEEELKN